MFLGFELVFPIFAIILLGAAAVRYGGFAPVAIDGLTKYVFVFAVPALLFRSLANNDLPAEIPWGLFGTYYGGIALTWAITMALMLLLWRQSLSRAAIFGFGTSFSNTVMLGLPILSAANGDDGKLIFVLILSMHGVSVFTALTVLLEIGQGKGEKWPDILKNAGKGILTNPIILALAAGALWGLSGLTLPGPIDRTLELLALSAIPVALFSLGGTLPRYDLKANLPSAGFMAVMKLGVHPLMTYLLGAFVFGLSALELAVATTTAAVATGVNTFIFANRYGEAEGASSSAIVLTTGLAMITISLLLPQFVTR